MSFSVCCLFQTSVLSLRVHFTTLFHRFQVLPQRFRHFGGINNRTVFSLAALHKTRSNEGDLRRRFRSGLIKGCNYLGNFVISSKTYFSHIFNVKLQLFPGVVFCVNRRSQLLRRRPNFAKLPTKFTSMYRKRLLNMVYCIVIYNRWRLCAAISVVER